MSVHPPGSIKSKSAERIVTSLAFGSINKISRVIDSVLKQLDPKGNISTCIKQCSAYADNILITTRTSHSLVATFQKLMDISAQVGLNINEQKTKYLRCTKKLHMMNGIYISQTHLEQVKSFKYLGSIMNGNNSIEKKELLRKQSLLC